MNNYRSTDRYETIACASANSVFAPGPVYMIPSRPGRYFTIMGVEDITGLPGTIITPNPNDGSANSALPERHAKRVLGTLPYWADIQFPEDDNLAGAIRSGDAATPQHFGYFEMMNISAIQAPSPWPGTIDIVVRYWELVCG